MNGSEQDDRQFENFLQGEDAVSRMYRQMDRADVPAHIDRAIIRQARAAVRKSWLAWLNPFSTSSWMVPVGVAASLGLAIGLAVFVTYSPGPEDLPPAVASDDAGSRVSTVSGRSGNTSTVSVARKTRTVNPPLAVGPGMAFSSASGIERKSAATGGDVAVTALVSEEKMTPRRRMMPQALVRAEALSLKDARKELQQRIFTWCAKGEFERAREALREYHRRYPNDDLAKIFSRYRKPLGLNGKGTPQGKH